MKIEPDDIRFRNWVRSLRCLVKGCHIPGIHPHHVVPKGRGGKDPHNVVPLCWLHHRRCHDFKRGMYAWFIQHNIEPVKEASGVTRLYQSLSTPSEVVGNPF